MKKSVVLAVLGLAAGAMSSFGQGQIAFNSYYADGVGSGLTTIKFGAGTGGLQGTAVGAGYSFDIYYSLTSFSDAAGSGALNGLLLASGSGSPSQNNLAGLMNTGATAGYFAAAQNFTLNPYSNQTVYFEVAVYQTGQSYSSSSIRGHSASFSSTLATGLNSPAFATFGSFTADLVAPVPEPSTLALAGLGGFGMLMALRRKQA